MWHYQRDLNVRYDLRPELSLERLFLGFLEQLGAKGLRKPLALAGSALYAPLRSLEISRVCLLTPELTVTVAIHCDGETPDDHLALPTLVGIPLLDASPQITVAGEGPVLGSRLTRRMIQRVNALGALRLEILAPRSAAVGLALGDNPTGGTR